MQKRRDRIDEVELVYNSRKDSARTRGIPFLLTLDEFKAFCERTGYLEKRGRGKDDMTIDRKKRSLGYAIDNIQMLTNSANVKKYHTQDIKEDYKTKEEWGTPF